MITHHCSAKFRNGISERDLALDEQEKFCLSQSATTHLPLQRFSQIHWPASLACTVGRSRPSVETTQPSGRHRNSFGTIPFQERNTGSNELRSSKSSRKATSLSLNDLEFRYPPVHFADLVALFAKRYEQVMRSAMAIVARRTSSLKKPFPRPKRHEVQFCMGRFTL